MTEAPPDPGQSAPERTPGQAIVFAPITDGGLVEQAVRRLTDAIDIGLLREGERLPPEGELAGQFGMAPMTLRAALTTLRSGGYIETRRGRGGGHFVTARSQRPAPNVSADSLVDSDYIRDLTDYRRAIASAAAARAAERAGLAEVEDLERQADAAAHDFDYLDYLRHDAQLHIGIAIASRSKRLWKEQTILEMEINGIALTSSARLSAELIEELTSDHAELLAAIRDRDPERARAVAVAHVDRAGEAMLSLVSSR